MKKQIAVVEIPKNPLLKVTVGESVLAKTIITGLVALGSELVENDEYLSRLDICNGCEKQGNVIVKGLNIKGCTVCNCPFSTKPRFKTHFSSIEGKIIETKCPINNW